MFGLLAVPLSFEAGFWSCLLLRRGRRNPRHVRDVLIHGGQAAKHHVPMLDEQLRRKAGPSTKTQAKANKWAVHAIRTVVNAKAFEYLTLMAIKARWPKGKHIESKVRLCL